MTPDWVAWLTLALVLIDTAMWIMTLRAVRGLAGTASPLIAQGLQLMARVPPSALGAVRTTSAVPPSALGAVRTTSAVQAQSAAAPEMRTTKKGVRYVIDPVSGMARFLPKGGSAPKNVDGNGPSRPPEGSGEVGTPPNSGGVDLNALARQYGYEPEQVAELVSKYAALIPPPEDGGAPSSASSNPSGGGHEGGGPRAPPVAGPDAEDKLIAAGIQAVLSGEASVSDVASTLAPRFLPQLIAGIRKGTAGGAEGGSAPSNSGDGW